MNIQNHNCIISNSQIGNQNHMINTTQKIDWKKWELFCQELKQKSKTEEEKEMVEKLEKKVKQQNPNRLKNFIKNNYPNFFADIASGIISSQFSDLIQKLFFPEH